MAKFAVVKALGITIDETTMAKVARNEVKKTFMSGIRKIQHHAYGDHDGTTMGDIELLAEGMDVYEIIWPLDPKKMREAKNAERHLEERLRLDAEMMADPLDNVSDNNLRLHQVVINA